VLDVGGNIRAIMTSAQRFATDDKAPADVRIQAIEVLGLRPYAESGGTLASLLSLQQPQEIQLAAISTLARFNDAEVGTEITKRWDSLTPRLRTEAIHVLTARKDRAIALLNAIESKSIQPSALDTTQAKFLRNHRDPEVKALAVKVLGNKSASTR